VLGIREIAELLEMSPATAYRSARALVGQGYLEQDAQSKYRLALGAIDLGLASLNATGLCKHARPYMEELGKRSGYEVILGVLDGGEVLVVDQVPSTRRDQSVVDWQGQASGKRLPAHSTSLGKALLAGLAGEQGIGDVAMENEEWRLGTCTIAAPVRDESGDVVAAVSVVAHNGAIELEDLTNRWSGWLLMTAERISKRLGYLG
jgi:DNA-binding IclR family transcriptional regulator